MKLRAFLTLIGVAGSYASLFGASPRAVGPPLDVLSTLDSTSGYTSVAGLVEGPLTFLYGTAVGQGTGPCTGTSCGTMFRVNAPIIAGGAWSISVLHTFTGGSDGQNPMAALVAGTKQSVWGTTYYGGGTGCGGLGCGTVFQMNPSPTGDGSWTERVIYSFPDYAYPTSSLVIGANGVLYGTTTMNGGTSSACSGMCGTVFQLIPPAKKDGAWTESTIYTFQGGLDGATPYAGMVVDSVGNLYGTTTAGGSLTGCGGVGCGTVFELSPPAVAGGAWTETVLYAFGGYPIDGSFPRASLVRNSAGVLYGTTEYGGARNCAVGTTVVGCGTVFSLTPPTVAGGPWTPSILTDFSGNPAGRYPYGGLALYPTGELFGTTLEGGRQCVSGPPKTDCGTIFALQPPTTPGGAWKEIGLHSFTGGTDGGFPSGTIIVGHVTPGAKYVYGTASAVIYRVRP